MMTFDCVACLSKDDVDKECGSAKSQDDEDRRPVLPIQKVVHRVSLCDRRSVVEVGVHPREREQVKAVSRF